MLLLACTPPPPPGRYDEGYDVYPQGAILSEIVCFDIGKTSRLETFRKERISDTVGETQGSGSMCFYNRETSALKTSVIQEHLNLLEIVEKSREASNEEDLEPWQKQFYQKELFELVETLLHKTSDETPKAWQVAKRLDIYSSQASRAMRGSLPGSIDIWEETISGKVDTDIQRPRNSYRL